MHELAIEYAFVLGFSQLFVSFESLFSAVLEGAGDTRAAFVHTVPYNLLRIPLAWFLAFPLGMEAAGVWWAINITTYMKAALMGWSVWRGGWSRLEI